MILVLDNYDSFVHNLARYVSQLGFKTKVFRSDKISITDIVQMEPKAIIISPGPCTPNEAGISLSVIKKLGGKIPILGICLGHQAIGQAFGASIEKAAYPTHGKARKITHTSAGLFKGINNPFNVARYHSLIVSKHNLPDELEITSYSDEGEIMSLRHKNYDIYGMQFHPESVLTEHGYQLLKNFFTAISSKSRRKLLAA